MEYVTVEELKKQLNIDHAEDDVYLAELLEVATISVEMAIQRPLTERVDATGRLNPMLRHAIRIMASNFYANRESVAYGAPQPVPYSLDMLLKPHRRTT